MKKTDIALITIGAMKAHSSHLTFGKSMKYKKEFGEAAAYEKAGSEADARDFVVRRRSLRTYGLRPQC